MQGEQPSYVVSFELKLEFVAIHIELAARLTVLFVNRLLHYPIDDRSFYD